jgi:hypothetical protein
MAQLGQFADNALSGASKFARAANIPSLMLTPNTMGDATLTGNNMALGPIDQMATDQYQKPMTKEAMLGRVNAFGDAQFFDEKYSINDGFSPLASAFMPSTAGFFMGGEEDKFKLMGDLQNLATGYQPPLLPQPSETSVGVAPPYLRQSTQLTDSNPPANLVTLNNLMTPELRDQRAADRQRKYGDIEQNPNAIGRFVQDVFNTPKEMGRRFDEFTGTLMRAATPEEELGYTPPSVGDVLATAGIRDAEGNIIGSDGRSEPITGPTRLPPAPITAAPETPAPEITTPKNIAPKIATPTDGMDITQRAITEAMGRTAETDAQRAELSPAQQNFLARKDKGTPLKPDEINAAQRYAVSQGQIFDPETGYSQAEFYGQRYKGQSIGDYLRGADTPEGATEQFVDAQGRLRRRMAGTDQLAPEYSSYERESEAREARLADRPDFMRAVSDRERRGTGEMSMAAATKLTGGDRKKARAMIELQRQGRDPLTGQPEGMTEYQREQIRQSQERIDLAKQEAEKPEGMTEYQAETLRQNQERIDFAKEEAEAARKAAEAKGATQAQKDAYDIAQKKVNLATSFQKLNEGLEDPVFDAKDIEADLDGIQSQLDIVYDPEASVFRRGKLYGKGEVIKIDDPKNASIVRTIGTYKVGRALLDIYPKKG